MIPFFGIDLETGKESTQINGHEFIIQKTSDALSQSLKAAEEKKNQSAKKALSVQKFRIIQLLCGLAACLSLVYGQFWITGIFSAIWLILLILIEYRYLAILKGSELRQACSHFRDVGSAIYKEFGIPDNAKNVDILKFYYRKKNNGEIQIARMNLRNWQSYYIKEKCSGEISLEKDSADYFQCEALCFKAFADNDYLYLANYNHKYAFPLSSIAEIHAATERICIHRWSKDEWYDEGVYKQYAIEQDKNYGIDGVSCNYNIIELRHQNETFGIYIPCYEIPVFEELIK